MSWSQTQTSVRTPIFKYAPNSSFSHPATQPPVYLPSQPCSVDDMPKGNQDALATSEKNTPVATSHDRYEQYKYNTSM